MPVLTVTYTRVCGGVPAAAASLPAPYWNAPSAARLASLSIRTGRPTSGSQRAFNDTPSRAGRLGGALSAPVSESTGPATAIPTPARSAGLAIRACRRTSPVRSITAVRIQVPPQSMTTAASRCELIYMRSSSCWGMLKVNQDGAARSIAPGISPMG